LADALARGMSIAEVAAFLGRTEEEVREQSKATKYPPRPRVQR
jgi:predicted transcriptional regulator